MFCPQCGTDYKDGFYICSDCQVPLISEEEFRELEDKRRMEEKKSRDMATVEVYRVQGEVEADIIKSLLAASGIENTSTGNAVQSVLPFTVDGLGELRIMVKEEDAEKARELIREYEGNNPIK